MAKENSLTHKEGEVDSLRNVAHTQVGNLYDVMAQLKGVQYLVEEMESDFGTSPTPNYTLRLLRRIDKEVTDVIDALIPHI